MRRSWQHWLRVCVVTLTVPALTMGPAWAGRGLSRCQRKRCRPACCRPVVCCPTPCESELAAGDAVSCCTVADAGSTDTARAVVDESAPSGAETPAAPESVVATPTRPDAATVAEAVPPLAPAAPVAPASVEAPVPPAPTPDLEAELAELKSELSDLKAGMQSNLDAGLSLLKSEMKTEISQLKSDMKSDLKTEFSELKTGVKSDLEEELAALKSALESQPIPQPVAAQQPARPAEDNIFEERKSGSSYEAFRDAEEATAPEMKDSPLTEPESEPEPKPSLPLEEPAETDAAAKPTLPDVKPAEPDSPFPLPEIPAPTLDEPAVPPPAAPAPAAEDADSPPPAVDEDPFSALSPEPVRRWIDDSGNHGAVGRLVEVHPDRVRILKLNGRFTTVPISRLSTADQNYVHTTGERLAAKPRLTDTAAR